MGFGNPGGLRGFVVYFYFFVVCFAIPFGGGAGAGVAVGFATLPLL